LKLELTFYVHKRMLAVLDRPLLPGRFPLGGQVVVGRTGCRWQDRLSLAGKVVVCRIGRCCQEWFFLAGQVVLGSTGYRWQDGLLLAEKGYRWQDRMLLAGQRCLNDRPLLPGQIFIGWAGCCWQGRKG
jgi:hypothetical protein